MCLCMRAFVWVFLWIWKKNCNNNKKGYYYFIVHNSEPDAVLELERNFKINENIIRFLTTKTSKIPSEPTPIMKAKIDKENVERSTQEVDLNNKGSK